MEGTWFHWVPVGTGEVNCESEVDLSSSLDVIQEGRDQLHLALLQGDCARVLVLASLLLPLLLVHHVINIVCSGPFPKFPHVGVECPNDFMISTSVPVEDVNLDVPIIVAVAKGSDFDIELSPIRIEGVFDHLRSVHQDVPVAFCRSRELEKGIALAKKSPSCRVSWLRT